MDKVESMNILGTNIEELLYLKRKKQTWLAEKCGVTPSHINQIIKGKVRPSLQLLKVMSEILEVTLDELVSNNNLGAKNISYEQMD